MKQAKHRRGILALMLSLVFTLSLLTACGGGSDSSKGGGSKDSSNSSRLPKDHIHRLHPDRTVCSMRR